MEEIYALGISCIELVQYWFSDYEDYFEAVNHLSNPHYAADLLFPLVSIFDAVFATQLLLCLSFGGWLNCILKWWLLEDRPYWWVGETTYYTELTRPRITQHLQTCETGPGSPSGHSTNTGMILMLALMWISHVMNDRKLHIKYWKYIVYPLFGAALGSVMFARMFVATHFPHQVVLGSLVGMFLAPALCIYVSDPYIWGNNRPLHYSILCHTIAAIIAIAIGVMTYWGLKLVGWNPQHSVTLAFRWCEYPAEIRVTTTPLFAIVQSTATMLGMALFVTPEVKLYRHYSQNRSLIISAFATAIIVYGTRHLQSNICKHSALKYYLSHFAIGAVKPALLLRFVPFISMWPFVGQTAVKPKTS